MSTITFRISFGFLALVGAMAASSSGIGATISFKEDVTNSGAYQAGAAYVQNSTPGTVFDNASFFAGAIVPSTRITRGLLSFDLSAIPTGATIDSVSLKMTVTSGDSSSVSENHTLTLHELTTPFVEGQATWDEFSTGNAWTTAGGDFSATVLSSVVADPTTISEDDVLTFSSSTGLVSLAQGVSDADGTIYLLIDSDSNADDDRGLFRLRGDDATIEVEGEDIPYTQVYPELVVDFTPVPVPEPASVAMLVISVASLGLVRLRR